MWLGYSTRILHACDERAENGELTLGRLDRDQPCVKTGVKLNQRRGERNRSARLVYHHSARQERNLSSNNCIPSPLTPTNIIIDGEYCFNGSIEDEMGTRCFVLIALIDPSHTHHHFRNRITQGKHARI